MISGERLAELREWIHRLGMALEAHGEWFIYDDRRSADLLAVLARLAAPKKVSQAVLEQAMLRFLAAERVEP